MRTNIDATCSNCGATIPLTASGYRGHTCLARRECCDTTYNCEHLDACPERGIAARAALPCDITSDGWCATHSTGAGPVYCEGADR